MGFVEYVLNAHGSRFLMKGASLDDCPLSLALHILMWLARLSSSVGDSYHVINRGDKSWIRLDFMDLMIIIITLMGF